MPVHRPYPKSLIIAKPDGLILLHCPLTLSMFSRSEKTLVGMNFFDLMSSHDSKFFKNNSLYEHHIFEHEGHNMVTSSPCKGRTIRYSTPYLDDVDAQDINVLTSKLVLFNMKMNNQADSRFIKSVGTAYLDLSNLVCQLYVPMVKIYTKRSTIQSRLRYYEKIKE